MAAGNFKLVLDKKEETLWLAPEKAGQQIEVPAYAELFGFGSGEYALSSDSKLNNGQALFETLVFSDLIIHPLFKQFLGPFFFQIIQNVNHINHI